MKYPDTPFEGKDAEEWKQKIEKVLEDVEGLKEDKKELQREINTFKSDLNKLGEKINKMPKRTWLRSVMGSTIKFIEKVALHDSIGKTLVGTAMKALLPDLDIPTDDIPKLSDGE